MDPVGYKEIRDIFVDLKKTGTTLFLNTHILDEVESICDRVGILHDGVLKDVASIDKIMESAVPVDYWVDVSPTEAAKLFGMPFQDIHRQNGGVQVEGLVLPETLTLLTSRNGQSERDPAPFLHDGGLFPEGHRASCSPKAPGEEKNEPNHEGLPQFTFRELIRSKMLFVWIISVVVLSGLAFLLSLLSFGEVHKIFMDLGLVGMELSGRWSCFCGPGRQLHHRNGTESHFLQLTKPITRGEYLLGRILGFFLVNVMVMLGMGVVVVGLVVFIGGGVVPPLFYGCTAFLVLELFVLTVLGLTFQVIATSMVGVVLYSFFTIFLGHWIGEIQWLLQQAIGPVREISCSTWSTTASRTWKYSTSRTGFMIPAWY